MTAPIAHRLRSYTATLQRTASSHHAALGGQTGKGTPQFANTMHARRCCITSPALQPLHQRTVQLPRLFPPTFPALLPRLRQPCHFINTARPSKTVCTKLSQQQLARACICRLSRQLPLLCPSATLRWNLQYTATAACWQGQATSHTNPSSLTHSAAAAPALGPQGRAACGWLPGCARGPAAPPGCWQPLPAARGPPGAAPPRPAIRTVIRQPEHWQLQQRQ